MGQEEAARKYEEEIAREKEKEETTSIPWFERFNIWKSRDTGEVPKMDPAFITPGSGKRTSFGEDKDEEDDGEYEQVWVERDGKWSQEKVKVTNDTSDDDDIDKDKEDLWWVERDGKWVQEKV